LNEDKILLDMYDAIGGRPTLSINQSGINFFFNRNYFGIFSTMGENSRKPAIENGSFVLDTISKTDQMEATVGLVL
jgi:hypothetical protein